MPPEVITPDLVLRAYCAGVFPMARNRAGAGGTDWYSPDPRALLPLDDRFKVRRSLARQVTKQPLDITRDRAFDQVISACAAPRPDGRDTWISDDIIRLYSDLHRRGFAHSVEAWRDGELVGGLYGVAIHAAYFGESMFSRAPYASQLCLVHLVEHLRQRGYDLLDVQFTNDHLEQFGVYEIPRTQYLQQLERALNKPVTW